MLNYDMRRLVGTWRKYNDSEKGAEKITGMPLFSPVVQ